MVTISVCLETVFCDLPAEARVGKIKEAGYAAVEFWHPEGTFDGSDVVMEPKDGAALRAACGEHGVAISDFAMHAWDGAIGGCPVNRDDHDAYLAQMAKMMAFGKEIGCKQGITLSGTVKEGLSRRTMRDNMTAALDAATDMAAKEAFTLLLEPLNTHVDHAGYYLATASEAIEILRELKRPNLKLLYDVYHMQIMEGNLLDTIEKNLDIIGHFHSAGVPGRGELFGGEVNYPEIVRRLDEWGYAGNFGLEYFPQMADHGESLRRVRAYLMGDA